MYQCDFGGMAVYDLEDLTSRRFNGQKGKSKEKDVEYFVAYKKEGLIEDELDSVASSSGLTPDPKTQSEDSLNPEEVSNDDSYDEAYGTSDDEYGEIERRKRISNRKFQQSKEEIKNTDE